MRSTQAARSERAKLIAAFTAVYVVWGSTYFAIKVAVETIPPLTAAGVRFVLAGVILFGWARFRGAPWPTRAQWLNLGRLGALMFLPTYAALFWAERTVPSGISAVLVATLPLLTILIEAGVLKRRRATPVLMLALVAGLVGVILPSVGAPDTAHPVAWLPSIAVVVAEVFWAIGSVITPRVDLPATSTLTAGGEMLCGGCLLLLAAAALGEWRAVHPPTLAGIGAMAYMIVAGSIVAFNSYVWLLGRTSATSLSSYTYVNPVVALAIGYQFGGEHLTPHALSGSLLVLTSVVLVQRLTKRGGPARQGDRMEQRASSTSGKDPSLDAVFVTDRSSLEL